MRLQVAVSHAGIASRRKAAEIIESGRVTVNGKIIRERGFSVKPGIDEILVDGKKAEDPAKIYIMLNKPKGVITTKSDPEKRRTVFDILPQEFRNLHPIGRLDRNTTGLLLLTNDGGLTLRLTHPRFEIRKKYRAVCEGRITDKDKRILEKGMFIDGKRTGRAKVDIVRPGKESSELFIEIHEGRKRQIRNMFLYLGHPIQKLQRVAYEFLKLGSLREGEFRYLTRDEVKKLKEL